MPLHLLYPNWGFDLDFDSRDEPREDHHIDIQARNDTQTTSYRSWQATRPRSRSVGPCQGHACSCIDDDSGCGW